ncbi:MAG: 16S rRNA (cytosine(1402)-N(4))-methyltransferase RsmH [Legionella sp.]|nr:16S rRNA (cytosine(1402)-N(4))-methyltransferase RsmH [Legionella sp.]
MTLHQPVLLNEVLQGLNIKASGIYLDGTFGRGGHSRAILQKLSSDGKLYALDKDPEAVEHAKKYFHDVPSFKIFHCPFGSLKAWADDRNLTGKIDGILLDVGVSSPQLDNPERGFSFMQNGPLDMRMDFTQSLTAAQFIAEADAEEMAFIFKKYGEERFAKRIAEAIVTARMLEPIETTQALATIVKQAHPRWEKHKHPATRVFQAIRIHINQELEQLAAALDAALDTLSVGGRLAVISFHSLEDRCVKQFLRQKNLSTSKHLPKEIPVQLLEAEVGAEKKQYQFSPIGGAIKANEEELKDNIRSRSATLRIAEKRCMSKG